jgi:hypothetical protein
LRKDKNNNNKLYLIEDMISKNIDEISINYSDIKLLLKGLLSIEGIGVYFDIYIKDGYFYLYPSLMTPEYIFISKAIDANAILNKYKLKAILEDTSNIKRVKVTDNS